MIKNIETLLETFGKDENFNKFYFVGGTALSSYLNHRVSYDIDFMSDNKLDQNLLNKMVVKYDARFIPDPDESVFRINTGNDLKEYKMQFMIDSVKIEFFYPNDNMRVEILKKYKESCDSFFGIKRVPLKGLGELKLVALFDRRKIRDLFDIYYLFYKKLLSCDDIDRFMSLKYSKTFVEFLDEFLDDGSESLDFLPTQEFSHIKKNKIESLKRLFREEYIKRCL